MRSSSLLRAELTAAVSGAPTGLAAADRLCQVCVELLDVDGASISLVQHGSSRGTFGSSGTRSRHLDELQFTYGEGPCLDSVGSGRPVLVSDLQQMGQHRWPALTEALLDQGVFAVFALPVSVARTPVGALDLFRDRPGALTDDELSGGLWAAHLAALPLIDLMSDGVPWADAAEGGVEFDQLASLERVEVYQATGMIMAALDGGPTEALVRLRGYAYSHRLTASEVAWSVVRRRLVPEPSGWRRVSGDTTKGP